MIQRILIALLFLTLGAVAPAAASVVTLDVSGTFGAGVLLNGAISLENTPFTYRALFDPAVNTGTAPGNLVSPTLSLAFTLNSVTYYGGSSFVYIDATDPVTPSTPYTVGLSNESLTDWQYFNGNYDSISTPFNAANPLNSILSGTNVDNSSSGLSFAFTGGATLSNLVFDAGASTATFSGANAVPEPSTYLLLTISLGAVGYARKKMTRREEQTAV